MWIEPFKVTAGESRSGLHGGVCCPIRQVGALGMRFGGRIPARHAFTGGTRLGSLTRK